MPCLILAHFEIPSESTFLAHYIGSTVLLLLQSVRAMLYLAVEGYTWRPDDVEETNALYDKISEEEVALGGLTSLEERAYNNLVEAEPINCRKKVTPDDSIGEARRDGLEVNVTSNSRSVVPRALRRVMSTPPEHSSHRL